MHNKFLIIAIALATALISAGTVSATPLGTNITTPDGNVAAYYHGIGVGAEDDETEGNPATYQSQAWDVEGLFLNGNLLQMIGGFKFDTGVTWNDSHGNYGSGDIFINVLNFGNQWDYAIRIYGSSHKYDVFAVNMLDLQPTMWQDVLSSSPWRVGALSQKLNAYSNKDYIFETLTDQDSGFSSWKTDNDTINGETDAHFLHNPTQITPFRNYDDLHYSVKGIDLGFLGANKTFDVHFTMECGNDLIVGRGTTELPEPTTILLLGIGMGGVGMMARWRKSR